MVIWLKAICKWWGGPEGVTGEQIEHTRGRKATRRGLGPGGTRGTIELLCRGGGGISAREAPTVVGWQNTEFSRLPEPGPLSAESVNVGGSVRSERRLEESGRRRVEPRYGGRRVNNMLVCWEQRAVPGFALDGVFRPRGLRLFCLAPPPGLSLILLTISTSALVTLTRLRCVSVSRFVGGKAGLSCGLLRLNGFRKWHPFEGRWRPCLISPQPAVQACLFPCVWRQAGSPGAGLPRDLLLSH